MRDYRPALRVTLLTALLLAGLASTAARAQAPDAAAQREAAEAEQIAPAYADYEQGRPAAAAQAFATLARQGNRLAQFNLAVIRRP